MNGTENTSELSKIYRLTAAVLGRKRWRHFVSSMEAESDAGLLPGRLASAAGGTHMPPFVTDLALLEWHWHKLLKSPPPERAKFRKPGLNPTVSLIRTGWRLSAHFAAEKVGPKMSVKAGEEWCMFWRHPNDGEPRFRVAAVEDLLVLKVMVENLTRESLSEVYGLTEEVLNKAFAEAERNGLIVLPPSRIRRPAGRYTPSKKIAEKFIASDDFTLQWHVTNACDLKCRHCYDRSMPSPLDLKQGSTILDSLGEFCSEYHVHGNISFSGGNPFLYPQFDALYQAADGRGFGLAILGNPVSKNRIEDICAIRKPSFFQVSLEGLPVHNDAMRGKGSFDRTVEFLGVLRELGIPSQVMLTLTADNVDQVLPLGKRLKGLADDFTYNRLAQVGEGAGLAVPSPAVYAAFMARYLEAAGDNPVFALKDNLINVVRDLSDQPLFGGCTGHGCGAAFNFIALLPDGEAHACRKFPSPIGSALKLGIKGVYKSAEARNYRNGCRICRGCNLRAVCGSCMAVTYGQGKDPLATRDSYCFYSQAPMGA